MKTEQQGESQVRVVDRRWWARGDLTEAETASRKPTVVEELEQRIADAGGHLQTVMAEHRKSLDEFEQVKARLRRDMSRETERGRRAVLGEFLDVLDNLDRALAATRNAGGSGSSEAIEKLTRGVELVRDQFLVKLGMFGVTRIPALGQPFDVLRHEAVNTAPVEDPAQDGVVVAVVREGYAAGDELVRPASVVVGKRQ